MCVCVCVCVCVPRVLICVAAVSCGRLAQEKHRVAQSKRDRSRTSHRPRWFRKVVRAHSRSSVNSQPDFPQPAKTETDLVGLLLRRVPVAQSATQGKRASKASPSSTIRLTGIEDEAWEYSGDYWETRRAGDGFLPRAATPFSHD